MLDAKAFAAAGLLAVLLGCGATPTATEMSTGGGSPNAPSTPSAATITITSAGVQPSNVTIAAGDRVTFVNQDTVTHDMSSDPHPSHTECPPMNAVGVLRPGQTGQTAAFTTARTCGFHDHDNPLADRLQGTIVIR